MSASEPPLGLIRVVLKGAVLLLTEAEYLGGIRRGKWWRRQAAMQEREATSEPSPVVASAGAPQRGA